MVVSRTSQAHEALQEARAAFQKKDNRSAYNWAKRAAQIAPELEEPWLLLAAVSNPEASIRFLEQALKINPIVHRRKRGWLGRVGACKFNGNTPKVHA